MLQRVTHGAKTTTTEFGKGFVSIFPGRGKTARGHEVDVGPSDISISVGASHFPPGPVQASSCGLQYRGTVSTLPPSQLPTPKPASSTSSSSSTPSSWTSSSTPYCQDPQLSELALRRQLESYPTDERTAYALFELLKRDNRAKEAGQSLEKFADQEYARGNRILASRCYADVAKILSHSTSSAGQRCAAERFRLAAEADPTQSRVYELMARTTEAKAVELEQAQKPVYPKPTPVLTYAPPLPSAPKPVHYHTSSFSTGQHHTPPPPSGLKPVHYHTSSFSTGHHHTPSVGPAPVRLTYDLSTKPKWDGKSILAGTPNAVLERTLIARLAVTPLNLDAMFALQNLYIETGNATVCDNLLNEKCNLATHQEDSYSYGRFLDSVADICIKRGEQNQDQNYFNTAAHYLTRAIKCTRLRYYGEKNNAALQARDALIAGQKVEWKSFYSI